MKVRISREDKLAVVAFQVKDGNDAVTNKAVEMSESAALTDFLRHACRAIRKADSFEQAETEMLLCVARLRTAASRLADC